METIKPIYNPGNACYVISAYHVFNSIKEFCESNEFFISALENVYTSGDITTFCNIIGDNYKEKGDSLDTINNIIKSFGLNCSVNYCRTDGKYSIKKDDKVLMFVNTPFDPFDNVPSTIIKDCYGYQLASAIYYDYEHEHYIAVRRINWNQCIVLDDINKTDYCGPIKRTINVDKIDDDGTTEKRTFEIRLACYKRIGNSSQ